MALISWVLCWRAYQAVFVADPGHAYDYRLTIEECRENMRFAISLDPFNALVPLLALSWRAITENVVPRARPRRKDADHEVVSSGSVTLGPCERTEGCASSRAGCPIHQGR